jgi:hypothetical protein
MRDDYREPEMSEKEKTLKAVEKIIHENGPIIFKEDEQILAQAIVAYLLGEAYHG